MQTQEPHELAYAHSAADGRDGRTLARMIVLLAMAVALAELAWQGVIYRSVTLGLEAILRVSSGWQASLFFLGRFSKTAGGLAVLVCGGLIMTSLYPRSLPLAVAFALLSFGAWAVVFVDISHFVPSQGVGAAVTYSTSHFVELAATSGLTAVLFTRPFARAVRRGVQS